MKTLQEMRITGSYLLAAWRERHAQHGAVAPALEPTDVAWCADAMDVLWQNNPTAGRTERGLDGLWAARWASSGWPILSLTESLTASLLLTDWSAVDPAALQLPFDEFVIELPWPRSPFVLVDEDSPKRAKYLTIHKLLLVSAEDQPPQVNAVFRLISPDTRLQLACVRLWPAHMKQKAKSGVGTGSPFAEDDDDDAQISVGDHEALIINNALDLVANLCLYLATNRSLLTPTRSGTSRPVREGELPPPLRWVLGREIKLSAEVREAAAAYAVRGTARKPWKLAARYVVRGHWRNQACGTGMLDHRMLWIAPYWKGPEEAPGLTRNFVVEQQTAKAKA